MKTFKLILILGFILLSKNINAQFNYQRSWGTYFGDERFILSDSEIDSNGNLYITGTIYGTDLTNLANFTNATSYQQNFGGGDFDGFLIKFNTLGQIVWGTFLGGSGFERISDIDIDNNDNIYVIGSTSSNSNIATEDVFQENLDGDGDLFISKFSSNGSVVWSTYFGGTGNEYNTIGRISYDGANNFYISSGIGSQNMATTGVFQETLNNSPSQISKFDLNGNRIWTTYYGRNIPLYNLKANNNGVYIVSFTHDCPPNNTYNTYFGTTGSYKPIPENCREIYLTKFNINGQRDWSTYYGGNLNESVQMKNCLDLKEDKIFFSGTAPYYINEAIATNGTYQPYNTSNSNFVAQFNQDGTRNWGTYNGDFNTTTLGSSSHVQCDRNLNNFYNYGSTALQSNISTPDGYQTTKNGLYNCDAFICKFTDQNTKSWGTYYGGELDEKDIDFHPYNSGNKFYIVGSTQSLTQMSTPTSLQPAKQVLDLINNTQQSAYNIFIAHFEPNPLSNESFINNNLISIYPNPANNLITIKNNKTTTENFNYIIFDVTGRIVKNGISKFNMSIDIENFSVGIYTIKIETENGEKLSKKLIKN